VVPQEYGIEKHDKVHIGLQIGSVLLRKIHHDLLAGTSPSDHEQERVHQLDTSHTTDVRTPQRHVRTRLYFTSESHIHSLFNVLRWGSDVSHMSGDTVSSIFSDEARAQFDDMELCYLTHVVFRVLHKKGKPSDERSSYMVQVLVSPGVNQDLRKGESRSTVREQMVTTPMVLSSRDDLTLEHIDEFINFFVRRDTEYIHAAPAQDGASGARARACGARCAWRCGARRAYRIKPLSARRTRHRPRASRLGRRLGDEQGAVGGQKPVPLDLARAPRRRDAATTHAHAARARLRSAQRAAAQLE
jgi:hypothetical protein